jgi:hypothetical protein
LADLKIAEKRRWGKLRSERGRFRPLNECQRLRILGLWRSAYFLSHAAGYADFLLAEKATSHDLRRPERRVTSGARICLSAGELVELIEGPAIAVTAGARSPTDSSRLVPWSERDPLGAPST